MPIRISIADCNPDSSVLLERLVSGFGFEMRVVASGDLLMDHVSVHTPGVIRVAESTVVGKSDARIANKTDCSALLKSGSKAVK